MNIDTLKNKKPWFVPKWLWNQVVNLACDAARDNLNVTAIGKFAGNEAMCCLERAIDGKDPAAIDKVCATVEAGSGVFARASTAARDGVITCEEKAEVGNAIASLLEVFVPQSAVDTKIAEVREALLF